MWADPNYLRSWRDLRRREFLFWFFVLSYVPGILLIIVVVNVLLIQSATSVFVPKSPKVGLTLTMYQIRYTCATHVSKAGSLEIIWLAREAMLCRQA